MIETELKITLDADGMARLRCHPSLAELRLEPRRRLRLLSIYCDTADHALGRAGMSLRLRRSGRRWVQTIKHASTAGGAGLFSHRETEVPAPGARLVLDGPDPTGALKALSEASRDAPLAPIFETRIDRMVERLVIPGLGVVELALDQGVVAAGDATVPILEAELELVEGDLRAVFALARRLFPTGPVAFSTANKAALGYALCRGEAKAEGPKVRQAGVLRFERTASVEEVARDVFRDCFAQISRNLVVVSCSEAPEGPHQLRVGLRRLRTAFSVFGSSLGKAGLAEASSAARALGQVVGRLRDADVLRDEVVAEACARGLDHAATEALLAVLEAQRAAIRSEVRASIAGPEATGFVFDLLDLVEARGWLVPEDYSQTARLAQPIAELAPVWLDKRHSKVQKMGKRIDELDAEALHELRKELKKLRYTVDMVAPIYPGRKAADYLRALKDMQDTFGSLNDVSMAAEALGPGATPAPGDPAAQRAVGWVLGTLTAREAQDRPALFARWHDFMDAKPFWT